MQVNYVVDDAGAGRPAGDDPHAICREAGDFKYASRVVEFEDGTTVAVHSYLDVPVDDAEAIQMATDYLDEIGALVGQGRITQ